MYGKIFESMYDGSIYGKWQAIVTFQQMLVLADKKGIVDMTPQALAARTSIPLEIIQKGIEDLESPDSMSRTPDEDGRRIIRLDEHRPWGWQITNYEKYRQIRSAEERREYHRQYWHKRKEKLNKTQQTQPIVDTDIEVDIKDQKTGENSPSVCKQTAIPYQEIIKLYHEILPELPKVAKVTKTRQGYMRQRWAEDLPELNNWRNFFAYVHDSDFLMGKTSGSNERPPFRADFEWLIKPSNFVKIAEGKYHV